MVQISYDVDGEDDTPGFLPLSYTVSHLNYLENATKSSLIQ